MNQKNRPNNKTAINKLYSMSGEIINLRNIEALLHWDQEVGMPKHAAENRANQIATISRVIHQKETSTKMNDLLKEAEDSLELLSEKDRALVRVMRRSYDQKTCQPEEFVSNFSKLTSQALQSWISARENSDFKLFQPFLEKIVNMSLQKAEYLGYESHPYNALLDLYEENLNTSKMAKVFESIKDPLIKILHKKAQSKLSSLKFNKPFDEQKQSEFSKIVLKTIGYDFNRGREDKTIHPFTISLGHHDRRVTNRYKPDNIDFIFGALHEGGHALYEQGISDSVAETHLDEGVSLGIHESQSRLWENMIGRSLSFWNYFYPKLQRHFPDHFNKISVHEFVSYINSINPSLIRVDADEVSYNLHVLIRFELEKSLLEKEITVKDLPKLWNIKYKEYLDIEVPDDAKGVLQDIHWSHGSIGYFPTYTLGNIYSAQIWNTYQQVNPDYEKNLRNGELSQIRDWLGKNIYCHGSIYPSEILLEKITGQKIDSKYFISYITRKYSAS